MTSVSTEHLDQGHGEPRQDTVCGGVGQQQGGKVGVASLEKGGRKQEGGARKQEPVAAPAPLAPREYGPPCPAG